MKMSRFQISAEEYEAIKGAEKAVKDKKTSKRLLIFKKTTKRPLQTTAFFIIMKHL